MNPAADPNLLTALVVGLMGLAALLWAVPERSCPECTHCKREKSEARARQAKKDHDWFHYSLQVPRDPEKCNRCREERP